MLNILNVKHFFGGVQQDTVFEVLLDFSLCNLQIVETTFENVIKISFISVKTTFENFIKEYFMIKKESGTGCDNR